MKVYPLSPRLRIKTALRSCFPPIVALPHTDSDGALAIAEFEWDRRPVTLSVGVASLLPGDAGEGRLMDPADLIALADQALYRSKAAGRNQVTAA